MSEIERVELRGLLERHALDVADGAGGFGRERRVDEEHLALGGDAVDDLVGELRLRLREFELLDRDEFAGGRAVEQRAAERQRLHLRIDLLGVVARLRAEHYATTAPERGTVRARTGAAGALLAPRLLATAADFAAGLGGVRALAVVRVDRDNDFLDGLEAFVALERRQDKILLGARRGVGTENGKFHGSVGWAVQAWAFG